MLGIKGSAKNVNDFAMSVKKAENLNVDIGLEDKYEDDDFNITTDAFDVVELTVGDYITPKMWDRTNPDLEDYIDDPNEDWLINSGWVVYDVYLTSDSGGELSTDIKDINNILKPKYKIVLN